ncbi:hypothetical protein DMENIID0001_092910 [Sergentomyia squamirostris]
MSPSLVADYKIAHNGLPNLLNGSRRDCNLCKIIKPEDTASVLLNRRGKRHDSGAIMSDKNPHSQHLSNNNPPTLQKIPVNINRHSHTMVDNRLQYRRMYDPEIFGRNQLNKFILPPLPL